MSAGLWVFADCTQVRDETETSSVWTDARRLRDVWCVKCTFEKVKISS